MSQVARKVSRKLSQNLMKAIVSPRVGPYELLQLKEIPRPEITEPEQVLVRVLAVSLCPGDQRRVYGDATVFYDHKDFIPGQDVCGIVKECGEEAAKHFKIGDRIVASDGSFKGALAEYCVLDSKCCGIAPHNLSPVEASTLPASAYRAMLTIEYSGVQKGQRVLLFGGSGGYGTFLIQFLKEFGVGYIACTSSDVDLIKSLGVDLAINYKEQDTWQVLKETQDKPFDVVIDAAGGPDKWPMTVKHKLLPPGNNFVAVSMDEPQMMIKSKVATAVFFAKIIGRTLYNKWNPFTPQYKMLMLSAYSKRETLDTLRKFFEEEKVRVVLEPNSPYEFTKEGVVAAFELSRSYTAKGKIAITVSGEHDEQDENLVDAS